MGAGIWRHRDNQYLMLGTRFAPPAGSAGNGVPKPRSGPFPGADSQPRSISWRTACARPLDYILPQDRASCRKGATALFDEWSPNEFLLTRTWEQSLVSDHCCRRWARSAAATAPARASTQETLVSIGSQQRRGPLHEVEHFRRPDTLISGLPMLLLFHPSHCDIICIPCVSFSLGCAVHGVGAGTGIPIVPSQPPSQ